jgi:uncharacterized protein (TIGR02594 family)
MATERDELRLTVTLVDNASAGLKQLKGGFKDLAEGSGKQHAERFKRENTEAIAILKRMAGEAGEAYKAFGMMRLGALGAAGGVALLGFEIAKQIKEMGELAEKMRGINQAGRLFGIKPEDIRNIQEQLEAFGVSAEQSLGALTNFMSRMGEMQRNPALRHDILLGVIRDPGAEREMERRLAQIDAAKSAIEKLNLVRQLGEDIERNALKRGETPERAAGERRMIEERLGYDSRLRVAGQLKDLNAEERKAEEARTKNMEAYANQLGRIKKEWDEITKLLSSPLFGDRSPMVIGATILENSLKKAKEIIEWIQGARHEHEEHLTPEQEAERARQKLNEEENTPAKNHERARTRRGAKPLYFSGGGSDEFGADWPLSTNIEDRRGEWDSKKYMQENTAELKRLNDFLVGPATTGTAGGGSYGFLGGGGAVAQRLSGGGINIPGAGGAGGRGASTGTGAPPSAGAAAVSGDPTVPGHILDQAKAVALRGGPGAVERFMAAQGYPKAGNWCGEFAAAVVKSQGLTPPKDAAVASNWRKFGAPVEGAPQPGDIAVRKGPRTGDTGSHVTFVENFDPKTGTFTGLGGNQGRFESNYSASRFDFRRPYAPGGQQPDAGQPTDEQRNVRNFMRGLSFLETSNDPRIAARSEGGNTGFFRQNANDAAWAKAHGLADPRVGTYEEQADANFAYMKKYPGAQEAIRRGDFKEAARLLHKNWVGLPGGSQPQSAARMREWSRILDRSDAQKHTVEGSGKITVDVNAPKGTNVGAEGKGLFKAVEINRQTQMEPARRGPVGFEE